MSENEPEAETEAETEDEESGDEGTNSPVVETVKESDGETVSPNQSEDTDATAGDGGDIDGA